MEPISIFFIIILSILATPVVTGGIVWGIKRIARIIHGLKYDCWDIIIEDNGVATGRIFDIIEEMPALQVKRHGRVTYYPHYNERSIEVQYMKLREFRYLGHRYFMTTKKEGNRITEFHICILVSDRGNSTTKFRSLMNGNTNN